MQWKMPERYVALNAIIASLPFWGQLDRTSGGFLSALITAISLQENGSGDATIVNGVGATGLMQVKHRDHIGGRPTADYLKDPLYNLAYGAVHFIEKFGESKDLSLALLHYHHGHPTRGSATRKPLLDVEKKKWNRFPIESLQYPSLVLNHLRKIWTADFPDWAYSLEFVPVFDDNRKNNTEETKEKIFENAAAFVFDEGMHDWDRLLAYSDTLKPLSKKAMMPVSESGVPEPKTQALVGSVIWHMAKTGWDNLEMTVSGIDLDANGIIDLAEMAILIYNSADPATALALAVGEKILFSQLPEVVAKTIKKALTTGSWAEAAEELVVQAIKAPEAVVAAAANAATLAGEGVNAGVQTLADATARINAMVSGEAPGASDSGDGDPNAWVEVDFPSSHENAPPYKVVASGGAVLGYKTADGIFIDKDQAMKNWNAVDPAPKAGKGGTPRPYTDEAVTQDPSLWFAPSGEGELSTHEVAAIEAEAREYWSGGLEVAKPRASDISWTRGDLARYITHKIAVTVPPGGPPVYDKDNVREARRWRPRDFLILAMAGCCVIDSSLNAQLKVAAISRAITVACDHRSESPTALLNNCIHLRRLDTLSQSAMNDLVARAGHATRPSSDVPADASAVAVGQILAQRWTPTMHRDGVDSLLAAICNPVDVLSGCMDSAQHVTFAHFARSLSVNADSYVRLAPRDYHKSARGKTLWTIHQWLGRQMDQRPLQESSRQPNPAVFLRS